MYCVKIAGIVEASIIVSPYDSIQNALNRLGLCQCHVVFKGAILAPALSFSFFGIKENDTIFLADNKNIKPSINLINAINNRQRKQQPRPLNKEMVQKMRSMFNNKYGDRLKDPENVFNILKSSFDPTSAREAARVNDTFRQRIESNPASFRKLYSRMNVVVQSNKALGSQQFPTVLPEKPLEPSTDLLPNFVRAIETPTSI